MEIEEDFQNVKNSRHLSKNENTMATSFLLSKKHCELLKFATIVLEERRLWKGDLKLNACPMKYFL
jgi:hypothetical protein